MDIQHYFTVEGSGEPLILLHGNGEDSGYFRGQIGVFAKAFRVYALDTRGHGKTPRGAAPFTIRQFADDLLGFMDAQQLKRRICSASRTAGTSRWILPFAIRSALTA